MNAENEKAEQLLTREQLAKRWQTSTRTIDRLRDEKKDHLKSTTIGGSIRFRLKDVQEFERRRTKHSLSMDFSDLSQEELDRLDPQYEE